MIRARNSDRTWSGRRFPTWLKISIAVTVLLGLAVAAMIKVLLEEPPPYAQPAAIQARFGEPIETLLGLATTHPSDGCADEDSPEELMRYIELEKPWWEEVAGHQDRFSDPAILGATVMFHCEGSTRSMPIKPFEKPTGSWSRDEILPEPEWPAVSLWRAGAQRFIQYEDRFDHPDGGSRGIRLTLDLERLE